MIQMRMKKKTGFHSHFFCLFFCAGCIFAKKKRIGSKDPEYCKEITQEACRKGSSDKWFDSFQNDKRTDKTKYKAQDFLFRISGMRKSYKVLFQVIPESKSSACASCLQTVLCVYKLNISCFLQKYGIKGESEGNKKHNDSHFSRSLFEGFLPIYSDNRRSHIERKG